MLKDLALESDSVVHRCHTFRVFFSSATAMLLIMVSAMTRTVIRATILENLFMG